MIKFVVLGFAALAIALPASADRGHGIFQKKAAVEVDARVQGLVDVDADVLKKSKRSTSILDLNATVGRLGAGVDLDLSKRGGLNLDVNLGKSRRAGQGGYEDCGCEGGVGN